MELSEKQKRFSQYFAAILKSIWNFEHFEKKIDPHPFCISEITDSEKVVRWIWKKSRFRGRFDKQYGERAQTLLKSPSQHLYHILTSLLSQMRWKESLLFTCQILGLLFSTLTTNGM